MQRNDILDWIKKDEIQILSIKYTALNGKLKELNIPTSSPNLERVLAEGERVDLHSLFKNLQDVHESDGYLVPEYDTAFKDPLDPSILNIRGRLFDAEGNYLPFSPHNLVSSISEQIRELSDLSLYAHTELEFYLIFPSRELPYLDDSNYHASSPYAGPDNFLSDLIKAVSQVTPNIKYGHAEGGFIPKIKSYDNDFLKDKSAAQYEIEFTLMPIEEAAWITTVTRWLIRRVAAKHGYFATFAPFIMVGYPGSGLHIHLAVYDSDGVNITTDDMGHLTEPALRMIGGLCKFTPSLTAFGNTLAASYFRFLEGKEAPQSIYWHRHDRSAAIRIPIAWAKVDNLATIVNPQEREFYEKSNLQTVEFRIPDGSAHVYYLLSAIAAVVANAFSYDIYLNLARNYQYSDKVKSYPKLPTSCYESAEMLKRDKRFYLEQDFPESVINYFIELLYSENDEEIVKLIQEASTPAEKEKLILSLLHRNLNRH